MLKYLLAFALFIVANTAHAQTSSPLQLNTTGCTEGAYPVKDGTGWYCSTKSGMINIANLANAVADNTALSKVPYGRFPQGLWRLTYGNSNGAPPSFWTRQLGTCASASLANDGGGCQNGPDGNSWVAQYPDKLAYAAQWGVKLDSATDSTTTMTAAIAYSRATGVAIYGNGMAGNSVAVTGNMQIGGSRLQDIAFKQLSPNVSNRRTLTDNAPSTIVYLKNVKVDRNGSATDVSTPADAAGIWLASGLNHTLDTVEVTGNGPGNGILISGGSPFLRNLYVHDMMWAANSDPGTEQINGIFLIGVTDVVSYNPRVVNLLGQIGSDPIIAYQTDAYDVVGESQRVTTYNLYTSYVSEGVDTSGSGHPVDLTFYDTTCMDNGSSCMKISGHTKNSRSYNTVCVRNGFTCAYAGGGNSTGGETLGPTNIFHYNAVAIDTGYGGFWAASSPTAFQTLGGNAPFTLYPVNFRCIDCVAIDTQNTPTMKYCVRNNEGPTSNFVAPGLQCSGYITAIQLGFTNGIMYANPATLFSPSDPTGTTSLTAVMMGLGSTVQYTPTKSGTIQLNFSGAIRNTGNAMNSIAQLKYNQVGGGVPANGDAVTGTSAGKVVRLLGPAVAGGIAVPFSKLVTVSGLVVGTPYWFDLSLLTSNAAGTASVLDINANIEELGTP